jgi:hypothetical protein
MRQRRRHISHSKASAKCSSSIDNTPDKNILPVSILNIPYRDSRHFSDTGKVKHNIPFLQLCLVGLVNADSRTTSGCRYCSYILYIVHHPFHSEQQHIAVRWLFRWPAWYDLVSLHGKLSRNLALSLTRSSSINPKREKMFSSSLKLAIVAPFPPAHK